MAGPYRGDMPRVCVFCGGSPTTREHVWPNWIRRRAAIRESLPHVQVFQRHEREEERRTWSDEPYKLTTRAVCAGCNNGWMAQLEEKAQSLLGGMLEGRGRELHRDGQRTLAAWALKTAMMFDQASPQDARAIPVEHYRWLMDHGEPPEGVWIWIASYDANMPGTSKVLAAEVTAPGQDDPSERNVVVRTFSVGPVAFQVLGTTSPALWKMAVAWPEPNVHQLWPEQGSFTWMPVPAFNDSGLAFFGERVMGELILRSERFEP